MNDNILTSLYDVAKQRKADPQEGSYTSYLFDAGLDKILKKVGEESTETVIAAKNGDNEALTGEISDLLYHLVVMMVECGLPIEAVEEELKRRSHKLGNLKQFKKTDKNT